MSRRGGGSPFNEFDRERPPTRPVTGSNGRWATLLALVILAIALLLGLYAFDAAIINKENGNPPCTNCRRANMDLVFPTVNNIQTGVTSGWLDATGGRTEISVAVGNNTDGGRIVTLLDYSLQILRKDTHEVLDTINQLAWPGVTGGEYYGEAYVQYDPLSNRFFYTAPVFTLCFGGVILESGPLCSGFATFGPDIYSVESTVVAADPLNGCAPLINAGAIAGSIALMQTDGTCDFTTMVENAQSAGAVGVIIFDNVNELVYNMIGTDPGIFIPSLLSSLVDGQALLANLPALAILDSGGPVNFTQGMTIGVSKSSAPNSFADDWFIYTYVSANWTGALFLDELKSVALPGSLIVTSESFLITEGGYGETQILAFDLTSLIDGTGTVPLWGTFMPSIQPVENWLCLAHNYPPLNSPNPYAFFVALGEANATSTCPNMVHSILVWWGDSQRLYNQDTPTELQITPLCFNDNQGTRQPVPLIPFGFAYHAAVSSAVVSGTSLYVTLPNTVSSVHTTVRWIEVDLSEFWSNGAMSIAQDADVNPTPMLDLTSPRIEVDRDGNVGLFFNSNGPKQPIDGTYVARLQNDPLNSMRYLTNGPAPNTMINWAVGNATFFNQNHHSSGWRYQGSALDPSDGKTIYMFTAIGDPNGPFDTEGRTVSFTDALGAFQINAISCSGCQPRNPNAPHVTPVNYQFETQWAIDNPWNRSTSIESFDGGHWGQMRAALYGV